MSSVTPYENESGDWWVAVEDVASETEAEEVLRGLTYSRAEFVGIETTTLMEAEWGDSRSDAPSRYVPAYHFVETGEDDGNIDSEIQ